MPTNRFRRSFHRLLVEHFLFIMPVNIKALSVKKDRNLWPPFPFLLMLEAKKVSLSFITLMGFIIKKKGVSGRHNFLFFIGATHKETYERQRKSRSMKEKESGLVRINSLFFLNGHRLVPSTSKKKERR